MPSLAEAKAHLRVDHDDDDALIGTYLSAAQGHVEAHVSTAFADFDEVPPALFSATLLMLGHLYENREAATSGKVPSILPLGVEALCAPHRAQLV
ncbi:head-tail connector protein [Algimonas porphyrae]|uniref:Phage gp6-like head-tail connector protein n=1 Tax=Algimonas porphyrae TaxID=1128113 RepID=A0ABQ5V0A5_9PROT|nr:head-tail connector protein [Algimonas porphyrae]GLQ20387.1 hypothetical protein GCM10007854_13420 [Algimonas porphyrae]